MRTYRLWLALLGAGRWLSGTALVVLGIAISSRTLADGPGTSPGKPGDIPRPSPNRSDEPLAEKMSLERSAAFLDGAAMAWTKANQCASCHTSYPYLMARPLLGEDAPALTQMRKFLED